jgi:hypothetical protein
MNNEYKTDQEKQGDKTTSQCSCLNCEDFFDEDQLSTEFFFACSLTHDNTPLTYSHQSACP